MFKKTKLFIFSHKIISVFFLVLIIGSIYFLFSNSKKGEANYVTEKVKRGDITTYVTGTGQIEAEETINLNPENQGRVVYVGVKAGDYVKKGKLLMSTDYSLAKAELEKAKLSLDDLKRIDPLDLLKEENILNESYNNGWNSVSVFMTQVSMILDEMEALYNKDGYLEYNNIVNLSSTGKEKVYQAEKDLYKAREGFDDLFKIYIDLSRESSQEEIKSFIKKAYDQSKIIANTVKSTESVFNYVVDSRDEEQNDLNVSSDRSDINSWIESSNNYVNDLLTAYNNILENEESLQKLKNGADEIDIRTAEIAVQTKQDSYNKYFLYAPFDGIIASFTAKVGELSGSTVGSIITKQKIALIYLNEVDIASVKIGQKSILKFDAIDGLSINGTVMEIDSVGTVNSGVVTYGVKIVFDNDDERVKPGMSTNVEIMTNSKQNILTISTNAIKTRNNISYVEVLDEKTNQMIKKNVEVGISDDTIVEIISGLNEEDLIILKNSIKDSSSFSTSSKNKEMMGGPMMGGPMMGGALSAEQ